MKKLVGSFFCIMFLFFIMAPGVQAIPIFTGGSGDLPYVGTAGDQGENAQDNLTNVNLVIDAWNDVNDPDLPLLANDVTFFKLDGLTGTEFPINSAGWEYLSVKYANFFDLFYIPEMGDPEGFIWTGVMRSPQGGLIDISHYTLWNGKPPAVSEPATMLLLGSGLLGLVVLRRKFIKK